VEARLARLPYVAIGWLVEAYRLISRSYATANRVIVGGSGSSSSCVVSEGHLPTNHICANHRRYHLFHVAILKSMVQEA
jgi:hypothetical protein